MNEIQSAMQQVLPGDAQVRHGFARTLLLMLPMFLLKRPVGGAAGQTLAARKSVCVHVAESAQEPGRTALRNVTGDGARAHGLPAAG